MRKRRHRKFIMITVICLFCVACATVPFTNRRQINFIPASTMLATSFQQYDEFIKTNKVSDNKTKVAMVQRVGQRLQQAVEQYMIDNNLFFRLNGFNWEFNLIESPEKNAWAMPGGKVVIYTGILDIAQDETGLAVIMGHEIAHAIAQHGSERMSQQLLARMGGDTLAAALKEKPDETKQLWMTAFGIGAQFGVLLPYSRLHESEADKLGLNFMAFAGYNPEAAVSFWQRMSESKSSANPPEFLSSHPSDQRRIQMIQQHLPIAKQYYLDAQRWR